MKRSLRDGTRIASILEDHPEWLEVKDAGKKGLGLFAVVPLQAECYLGDYKGEILSSREYSRRYRGINAVYVFLIDDSVQRRDMRYIDASNPATSNILRFMNHASDPNVEARRSKLFETQLVNGYETKISFYLLRNVQKGEELCFDYGSRYPIDKFEL